MVPGEPGIVGESQLLAEALAGTIDDDFGVSGGFSEDAGDFPDGEALLIVHPESGKFIAFEFVFGELPKGDGVMWLGPFGGRMIGVEEGRGGLVFSPLRDGGTTRDGEEPGEEIPPWLEGLQFTKGKEEGFLGEVFGVFLSAGELMEETVNFLMVAMNDFITCRHGIIPAGESSKDEFSVGVI